MWLPTFLQRGIHFFDERTEVLAFNNFVLFDRVHLPIIGKRAAVVEEDLLSVRESARGEKGVGPFFLHLGAGNSGQGSLSTVI